MGLCKKDIWLCAKESNSIISFFFVNLGEGYLQCAYMMIHNDVAYARLSNVWTVMMVVDMLKKGSR